MLRRLAKTLEFLTVGKEVKITIEEKKLRAACFDLIGDSMEVSENEIDESLFETEVPYYRGKFLIYSDGENVWIKNVGIDGQVVRCVVTELIQFGRYADPFPFAKKPLRNKLMALHSDDSLYDTVEKIKLAWQEAEVQRKLPSSRNIYLNIEYVFN